MQIKCAGCLYRATVNTFTATVNFLVLPHTCLFRLISLIQLSPEPIQSSIILYLPSQRTAPSTSAREQAASDTPAEDFSNHRPVTLVSIVDVSRVALYAPGSRVVFFSVPSRIPACRLLEMSLSALREVEGCAPSALSCRLEWRRNGRILDGICELDNDNDLNLAFIGRGGMEADGVAERHNAVHTAAAQPIDEPRDDMHSLVTATPEVRKSIYLCF